MMGDIYMGRINADARINGDGGGSGGSSGIISVDGGGLCSWFGARS